MRNAGLAETQFGIKISEINVNNFRYADDTTLMVESEKELKTLLMTIIEERENAGFKVNIKKLRSWHPVPSLQAKRWGNSGNSEKLDFLGLQNHCIW